MGALRIPARDGERRNMIVRHCRLPYAPLSGGRIKIENKYTLLIKN
jgi:hypothetical protein